VTVDVNEVEIGEDPVVVLQAKKDASAMTESSNWHDVDNLGQFHRHMQDFFR
jgi:hypothetical protein